MWRVNKFTNTSTAPAAFTDGQPIDAVRGPEGASFRLVVGSGSVDFTDTGHQPGGPRYWQIVIGDSVYWYDGEGAIELTVSEGSYQVRGDGNAFDGTLIPLPTVSTADVANFDWMMQQKYVPYQDIPDSPGRTDAELRQLGLQYFPDSPNSFELAMSLYDWTTADFTRIDFLRLFAYTGLPDQPLNMDGIATAIWTADWRPYVPQNKDYMNSFFMQPADSLPDVQQQLAAKAPSLVTNVASEVNLISAASQSMPRTSCLSKARAVQRAGRHLEPRPSALCSLLR